MPGQHSGWARGVVPWVPEVTLVCCACSRHQLLPIIPERGVSYANDNNNAYRELQAFPRPLFHPCSCHTWRRWVCSCRQCLPTMPRSHERSACTADDVPPCLHNLECRWPQWDGGRPGLLCRTLTWTVPRTVSRRALRLSRHDTHLPLQYLPDVVWT